MTLHLIKLSVGCDTIGDLEAWIAERRRTSGEPHRHVHTTRMMPKRGDRLRDGSLFWVIRGQLACRQRLLEMRPVTGSDGIARCQFLLDPAVVPVAPRPVRPFQGWRYLEDADAPPDLGDAAAGVMAMPETLRRELVALGLL